MKLLFLALLFASAAAEPGRLMRIRNAIIHAREPWWPCGDSDYECQHSLDACIDSLKEQLDLMKFAPSHRPYNDRRTRDETSRHVLVNCTF